MVQEGKQGQMNEDKRRWFLVNYWVTSFSPELYIAFGIYFFFSDDISEANLILTLVKLTFPPPWKLKLLLKTYKLIFISTLYF